MTMAVGRNRGLRPILEELEASFGRSNLYIRHLEAIQRIAADLTRLATVEEIGQGLCAGTHQVIDYHNCRFYVVDPNGVDLMPLAFSGDMDLYGTETFEALRCRVGEEGEGVTGWVAARGEPLIVPDVEAEARAVDVPGTPQIQESMLLVPMRYEDRVTGVVVLSKLGHDQFTTDDLRLLQILADQAAIAVENARLLAGRNQVVRELEALLDISRSVTEVSEERELAALVAGKLRRAAGVEACIVSGWERGSTLLRALAADGIEVPDEHYDIAERPAVRRVLRFGDPLVVQADDPAAHAAEVAFMERMGIQTLLVLPCATGGRAIGLVELASCSGRADFTQHDIDFCATLANHAGTVLENVRLMEQLRHHADIDQLTGVANHRYLHERLAQEVARAGRTKSPLSVLMMDLDGFKRINDTHGHADGDGVLRDVAAAIKVAVRANDIVARYGGDEFVVLMPDTPEEQARIVEARVLRAIEERRHELPDGSALSLTASAGLAVYPDGGNGSAALLRAADESMYARKRARGGSRSVA